MSEFLSTVQSWIDPEALAALVLGWSGRVVAALLIFAIGRWVALAGWFARAVGRTGAKETLVRFSTLESNGLTIRYPQRDIHIKEQAAGNA